MNYLKSICILLITFPVLLSANSSYRWQTTHDGQSSGSCQLVSSSIHASVYDFHVDIVEEAEIKMIGTVWRGDETTLEIFGEFTLSKGTAVRSMLLWNGDQILKARLKERAAADSAYEDVVDRNAHLFVRRDPALIEYRGQNRYGFKIYPVNLNESRKIRILYTVPLRAGDTFTQYDIKTAFTAGASYIPDEIPLTIDIKTKNRSNEPLPHYITYGGRRRLVSANTTYIIPSSAFASYNWYYGNSNIKSLKIIPKSEYLEKGYAYSTEAHLRPNYFYSVYARIPEVLINDIGNLDTMTVEARISIKEKSYACDVKKDGIYSVSIKSQEPWDNAITWTAYNSRGDVVASVDKKLAISNSIYSNYLPLIWAANYSLDEEQGALGAMYGFVDSRMSLLALEEDVLESQFVEQYTESGVPQLTPEEIIFDDVHMPQAPLEYIDFDIQAATALRAEVDKTKTKISIVQISNREFEFHLPNVSDRRVSVTLFDMQGRLVFSKTDFSVKSGKIHLILPSYLKGSFIMKIHAGVEHQAKRIVLR